MQAHTPELPITPLKSSALYISKSVGRSSRSLPLAATTTKVHITSNATGPTNDTVKSKKPRKHEEDLRGEPVVQAGCSIPPECEKTENVTSGKTPKIHGPRPNPESHVSEVPKAANKPTGWLNWFSKSEIATANGASISDPHGDAIRAVTSRPQNTVSEALREAPASSKQRRNSEPIPVSPSVQQEEAPRSWLNLWGNASTLTKDGSSASAISVSPNPQTNNPSTSSQTGRVSDADPSPVSTPQTLQRPTDGAKSSYGWAFWSRDQPRGDVGNICAGREFGDLALAGSLSQSKPESGVIDAVRGVPDQVGKGQRPQTLDVAEDHKKPRGTGDDARKDVKMEAASSAPKSKPNFNGPKAKPAPDNLLLPSFTSTYSTVERPSLIQQITNFLQLSSPSGSKHVNIIQNPPRVKRALAIVSLALLLCMSLHHVTNLFSLGCPWLFPGPVDSLCPRSTNRHIYSLCQRCS